MVEDLFTIITVAIYTPVYRYGYDGDSALSVLKGIAGPQL